LDQQKESDRSEFFRVSNYFRRSEKMSAKSIWLMGFLVLALAFGGLVSNAGALPAYKIDDIDIEGTDAEGKPSRDEYGIRGIKIALEGEIDERDDEDLGNLVVRRGDGTEIIIRQGLLHIVDPDTDQPGHGLMGTKGTRINSDDEIRTNSDGEFVLTFILPFDVVGNTDEVLTVYFTETEDGKRDGKD
jgi:hypothetical protein